MSQFADIERPVLAPFARYRWDKHRDQHQIVYPEGVLVLNETGHHIISRCDGRTLPEVIDELESVFDASDLGDDVRTFLIGLFDIGLLRDAS